MFTVYTILGAVAVLLIWAAILWIGARLDKPHLDAEHARLRNMAPAE